MSDRWDRMPLRVAQFIAVATLGILCVGTGGFIAAAIATAVRAQWAGAAISTVSAVLMWLLVRAHLRWMRRENLP